MALETLMYNLKKALRIIILEGWTRACSDQSGHKLTEDVKITIIEKISEQKEIRKEWERAWLLPVFYSYMNN